MDVALRPWAGALPSERTVSTLDAMKALARTVPKALARAGETVKRRRLAATGGAPADATQ